MGKGKKKTQGMRIYKNKGHRAKEENQSVTKSGAAAAGSAPLLAAESVLREICACFLFFGWFPLPPLGQASSLGEM